MSDKWNALKDQMTKESESQIVELPPVATDEKETLAEKALAHIEAEFTKELKDRRFYEDGVGGVIVVVRFPKQSVAVTDAEKKTGKKGMAGYPKITLKNNEPNAIHWWGLKLPLMKGSIATCFFPLDWKELLIDNGLWEPEQGTKFMLMRGKMERKDRWLTEAKTSSYHRPWSVFKKEAEKRCEGVEINSVYDIPDGMLDREKYTFNITQWIKEL